MSELSSLLTAAGKCPVHLSSLLLWTRWWECAFKLVVSSQRNYSPWDVQLPRGGGWGDCLGTEWRLNSGKIKLTERQLQKDLSEIRNVGKAH